MTEHEAREALRLALGATFAAMASLEEAGLDPSAELLGALSEAAEANGVELPPMISMLL
jgi:hypothetical protein